MSWWDIAGSLVGGGLSWLGAQQEGQNALEASQTAANSVNRNADNAIAAAQPWGMGGAGGTASYDTAGRKGMMELSPELGGKYQGALARNELWGNQVAEYGNDPFAAADTFYNQMSPYYSEQEDRARTGLETRLLQQGRLGSTGGQGDMRALEEGIAGGQTQRRNQSFSQAQAMIDSLLGRESGDLGTATGLLDIPLQYANAGRGIGGTVGGVAAAGLQSRASAANNLSGTFASGGTPTSTGLQALGGLFSKYSQPVK